MSALNLYLNLNLYLHLYFYLHLNLYLYLYLYLRQNGLEASICKALKDFTWQSINQIRPLINVAGRIPTALMLRPGWKPCQLGVMEAQVSKRAIVCVPGLTGPSNQSSSGAIR